MTIALITARGGSKGLPHKNIISLNGVPLIAWTIKAALKSKDIDKVFVSTEDAEIVRVSQNFGAEIIHRPLNLALDTSSSESVVAHAIDHLKHKGLSFDTMILLQPTSPLRTSAHIDEAFYEFKEKSANIVISVFEPTHTPIKAYMELSNGELTGLYSQNAPYTRRQELPRAFQPNGAIYIFTTDKFIENSTFPTEGVFPFIMSEQDSADIDTLEDLLTVEKLIKSTSDEKSNI